MGSLYWVDLGGSGEFAREEDFALVSSPDRGDTAARFTVTQDSYVAGGVRAELTFDQLALEGAQTFYQYSLFIPPDYPDVPLYAQDRSPNWQILGQWHQQPVFSQGETWDAFTGKGESPPIGLYYNYLGAEDPDYQAALESSDILSIPGMDPSWSDVSTLTLSYGQESVAITAIEKGRWYRVRFHIRWSQGEDGWVQLWLDDQEITPGKVFGPNMLNSASHYFKFGLYRNPGIEETQVVYYDDIQIGILES